jgi:hypothetical protein
VTHLTWRDDGRLVAFTERAAIVELSKESAAR